MAEPALTLEGIILTTLVEDLYNISRLVVSDKKIFKTQLLTLTFLCNQPELSEHW